MATEAELLELIAGGRTARDAQEAVGPSEVGGCTRRLWHRLQGHPQVNATYRLQSTMGTAFHAWMEERVRQVDPWRERFLTELEVTADAGDFPLTGHIDLFDCRDAEVVDWKTTTLAGLRQMPRHHQVTQVHLYGWLLARSGVPVRTVTLVGIPRDADENMVRVFSGEYDPNIAARGLRRLAETRAATEPPQPEERVSFCRDYCPFWDASGLRGCPGRP